MPTKICIVKAMVFPVVMYVQVWKLDHTEGLVQKNWCLQTVVLKKTLESPLDSKEIKPVNAKGNKSWICIERIDAEAEAPIFWPPDAKSQLDYKRPWCWERVKAGGEGVDRGWDGWMASPTQWIWVWANFWRWWKTGKPGVLQSRGPKKIRHDWATEQQQVIMYAASVELHCVWCQSSTQNSGREGDRRVWEGETCEEEENQVKAAFQEGVWNAAEK